MLISHGTRRNFKHCSHYTHSGAKLLISICWAPSTKKLTPEKYYSSLLLTMNYKYLRLRSSSYIYDVVSLDFRSRHLLTNHIILLRHCYYLLHIYASIIYFVLTCNYLDLILQLHHHHTLLHAEPQSLYFAVY